VNLADTIAIERRGRLFEPLVFGIAATVFYAALGQRVFYKTDGPDLLWLLEHGINHPWHVGYLPLLALLRGLLAPLHLSDFAVAELYSALGAGLAVGCLRAGLWRLGVPRTEAWLATALLAFNPGVLLFGTVIELHGPMLGACGVAFLWMTVQVTRPRWWGMALLGVLTHIAFLMHSTGLFLPALLLSWFLALRWRQGPHRRDLLLCLLAGAVHTAMFLLLPRIPALRDFYGNYADLQQAFAVEASIGREQSLRNTGEIFLQEWPPLQPVSIACAVAFLRARTRLEALAMLLGLLPFLYICVRQLKDEPEHGAYLLPLLLPAARLTAAALPSFLSVGLVIWSVVTSIWQHGLQEAELWPQYATWQRELLTAADGHPFLALIGRHEELGRCQAMLQPDEYLWVRDHAAIPRAMVVPEQFQGTEAYLRGQMQQGRSVLLTAGGFLLLADPLAVLQAETPHKTVAPADWAGPDFLAHLRAAFRCEPAVRHGDGTDDASVAVWRLSPK
jgi:hypothetical protein